ncbi:MAG: allophycocyanin [Leptolyngbya sp. LCM1.Bin17]|uniref:allophycocyanin n=1 Tax=Nodosilinea sp. P-1105 TaxID=2546229 RepID=UPI0013FE529A|nr:allophycocyanin [Nodosilinea sp. P-1105]NMF86752.1 allophycocyanin [Nodosilinea sp. P-1105]TVP61695.1 MAG: allophycocyanin [Leptolyngbya sp. LCM1.Bin17]
MSIVKTLIVNADAECRYLTPGEVDQIKIFVASGTRRVRLVQALADGRDRIVKQAANQLFQKNPSLVAPGGNAYGKDMTATCLRDMDYYLRLVSYGVAAGDTTPIEEIGVIGVRQMYNSLGTPMEGIGESIRAMKTVTTTLLSAEDNSEVGAYFDYLIQIFR